MSRYVRVSTVGLRTCEANKRGAQSVTDFVIKHLEEHIRQVLCDKPDLIVLPEHCDRPLDLSMEERFAYYAERGDAVLDVLKRTARENNTYITYPARRLMRDGTARNSCQMINRSGEVIGIYDKNHAMIEEMDVSKIVCGRTETIFDCDFGRVGALICFDLNFDEIRQRLKQAKPDIVVFPSMYHGGLMQNYLAYNTRSYFVGAVCQLPSEIISPVGERLASSTNYYNFVTADINLDYQVIHLDYNMKRIRAARQKYGDKVKFHDPGLLGSVLLTSETDEFTAADVVREFELEVLDDYFERSLKGRVFE